MREFKFRGKRVGNDEWVYGDLVRESGETYIFLDFVNTRLIVSKSFHHLRKMVVDPKTVGQYIGRKDKYNKKMYEGDFVDVVMHEDVCNPSTKYLIEYHNTGFYLKGKDIEGDIGFVEICGGDCCIKSMEIIGNKHENPELLEDTL